MAQTAAQWPEPYIAGASLTYDGTLPEHLEFALPALDLYELKGTFYAYPPHLIQRLPDWRSAIERGHELGNGFLYGAVNEDGLIPHWPAETLREEFDEAEALLRPLRPNSLHATLAYPMVRTTWAQSGLPIVEEIVGQTTAKINAEILEPFDKEFSVIRKPMHGFNDLATLDPRNLRCYSADGLDGDSLCVLAHMGITQGAWTIFTFNGLARSAFDAEAHLRLCEWLAQRRGAVMVDNLTELYGGTLQKSKAELV